MAKKLKVLSLRHDKVLFIGGMAHIERILEKIDLKNFPPLVAAQRSSIELCTLTEESCREVLAEHGWLTDQYEQFRNETLNTNSYISIPDRQKIIYNLLKEAGKNYVLNTGNNFPGYCMRNLMKFLRNYSLVRGQLMPNLFQILSGAKGCVDHNYAYEVWELATRYPYLKNIDNLEAKNLKVEDIWGHSKIIRFDLKLKNPKAYEFKKRHKNHSNKRFIPPNPFSICSYPPEDILVERFGKFLKKKGTQILTEEGNRTLPFSTSIEEGVDVKETIRHWHEKKLYVRHKGKPPGGVGSVVVIFDEDAQEFNQKEKFPWRTTWIGEHNQESDMAFYATHLSNHVVGPGISRCEYGGFLMSYPPQRMFDVWSDPEYENCQTKAEILLMAAIDYSLQPLITYVASKPPRSILKSYARRYGKKIVFIPIGQLSPITLNKLRAFHVLDGKHRRDSADEYIF